MNSTMCSLPDGHLVRMDLILLGNLDHGFLDHQGFESYPGLERRGMVSSRSWHRTRSCHRGNVSSPFTYRRVRKTEPPLMTGYQVCCAPDLSLTLMEFLLEYI